MSYIVASGHVDGTPLNNFKFNVAGGDVPDVNHVSMYMHMSHYVSGYHHYDVEEIVAVKESASKYTVANEYHHDLYDGLDFVITPSGIL